MHIKRYYGLKYIENQTLSKWWQVTHSTSKTYIRFLLTLFPIYSLITWKRLKYIDNCNKMRPLPSCNPKMIEIYWQSLKINGTFDVNTINTSGLYLGYRVYLGLGVSCQFKIAFHVHIDFYTIINSFLHRIRL